MVRCKTYDNGKGERKYSKYINFNKKFKNKPNIIVSLKDIDVQMIDL